MSRISTSSSHDTLASSAAGDAELVIVKPFADTQNPTAAADNNKSAKEIHAFDIVRVPLSRIEFALVYVGLAFGIFLASLDQTIVSTAIPAIANDFKALDQISWVGTAYLLSSTSFAPLYGKFADIFGRKPTFMFAIFMFMAGSFICGIANSINVLIVGRAVAGMGGGGIIALVIIIISDIVSLRDRGKYQGIIGSVFALSSVVGPLLGGLFTDSITWRWCFYINLPIGAITFAVVAFLLKFPATEGSIRSKLHRIDYLGTFLIVGATICLLIPLQYGGTKWAWSDWKTITMIVISVLVAAMFIYVERNIATEPIIPPGLFENVSVYALLGIAFFIGASFYGLVYFLPSYFQLVNGDTATVAGLETVPMVFGLVIMSVSSGLLVSKYGYYTPFFFFGSVVLTVGAALASTFTQYSTRAQQIGYLIIIGMGIGCMIQVRVIGIQASVSQHNIAIATATSSFFQSLGGAIGVAVVGTVFNNVLDDKLGDLAGLVRGNPSGTRNYIKDPAKLTFVLDGFSQAFDTAYRVIIPLSAAIFVVALLVKQQNPNADTKKKTEFVMAE